MGSSIVHPLSKAFTKVVYNSEGHFHVRCWLACPPDLNSCNLFSLGIPQVNGIQSTLDLTTRGALRNF